MLYICILKMSISSVYLKTPLEEFIFGIRSPLSRGTMSESLCTWRLLYHKKATWKQVAFLIIVSEIPLMYCLLYCYSGWVLKVKLNILPFPGSLSTHIFPLCASTICLQMARPKPVPPGEFLERSLSTL